jgi:glycosyltransferase involved in cell wall biosynthesis
VGKELHVISFDIPFPADYGGSIDQFHLIRTLHHLGVTIHLHCFKYKQTEQITLTQYCKTVHYYDRIEGHAGFSNKWPYIVSSRINEELYKNLLQDNYSILAEGVHTSGIILDERFSNRAIYVRVHNVEHLYYNQLATCTKSVFKKLYYKNEARLLKYYEALMASKVLAIFTLSKTDSSYFQTHYQAKNIIEVPVFLPDWELQTATGMGSYCLYHSDLSVDANEKAAIWLLKEVFDAIKIPFVIAGKNPSKKLEKAAYARQHTCLVANPSEKELQDMIAKAHINILPSFTDTGIKIKLINALFNGKHIVANEATLKGADVAAACHVGTTAAAFKDIITQLYHQPFSEEEVQIRKKLLADRFNNRTSATTIINTIFGH